MQQGKAKVGMRISWNSKARRTKGIGTDLNGEQTRFGTEGVVIGIDGKNSVGSQLLEVSWDDNPTYNEFVSPYWIEPVAQRIEQQPSKLSAEGSSPSGLAQTADQLSH